MKNRLELTWIGKYDPENKINPEPRILMENAAYSYAAALEGGTGLRDNLLIHGDNLLALKSLEQEYAGRVKCIYVDPPYNINAADGAYDDNLEHSKWLSLIRPRFELLWSLLDRETGSLWVSIDDYEMPYLRVLLDEICGRGNFIASNVWQKRYSRENREAIGDVHEYIIIYAKNPKGFKAVRNLLPPNDVQKKVYRNPNNDPRGPWRPIPMTAQGYRANQMYPIEAPGGKVHIPPQGRCWSTIESEYKKLLEQGRIYFGVDNNSQPNIIRYLSDVDGFVPWTWWPSDEVGHTDEAKKEMHALFGKDRAFPTPKPERLVERVLTIATNPGDLVLDSFLGSGTTAAVAHKMGRRWIGIEMGDHAYTHCQPRLKAVVDSEQGGISGAVGWKGGGGFRFLELASSLLTRDKFGNMVISKEYNAEMLAAACAKHEGYAYSPHAEIIWKQGFSGDKNFIFTTTGVITAEYIDWIASELSPDENLLICAKGFDPSCARLHPNIVVKQIPRMLLGRCEFGRDNYDLNVIVRDIEDEEWEDDRE